MGAVTFNGSDLRVVVVGAGASGICVGIKLQEAFGSDVDYTIYEKLNGVGGTWLVNTYPNCGCDVPSHNYVYPFALNPRYSKVYSTREEIWQYFDQVARSYDVMRHICFGTEVLSFTWDHSLSMWRVRVRLVESGLEEESLAHFVITGTGGLSRPSIPKDVPGLETFQGPHWHSAEWNHSVDLKGKRVAVIGNGASAVQFIPEIAKDVAQLYTFQRTPNWILPQLNSEYSALTRWVFDHIPLALAAHRLGIYYQADWINYQSFKKDSFFQNQAKKLCLQYLHSVIKDPVLREKVTPQYEVGCKRVLMTDHYYPALLRHNVELVTDGLQRYTPHGVITKDGKEREVDVIIFATGFKVTEYLTPIKVTGLNGIDLHEQWGGCAQAYMTMTVSNFPNLFLMTGPNSGLGHNSILAMITAQADYAMRAIRTMQKSHISYFDVKPEAQTAFHDKIQRDLQSFVWAGSCSSWYKLENGYIGAIWPGNIDSFFAATRVVDWSAYRVVKYKPQQSRL